MGVEKESGVVVEKESGVDKETGGGGIKRVGGGRKILELCRGVNTVCMPTCCADIPTGDLSRVCHIFSGHLDFMMACTR